ncbi:MAG: hypothetical protein Q7S25_05530 [Candidatus Limnocylindria bacterium]|nr:hypothetical protein [Candidatus Limnocylindria bacterium]
MIAVVISTIAGTVAYLASPRARAAVRANLAVAVPERHDRERLVWRAFVWQARHYLEILALERMDPAAITRAIRVVGWEHFFAAHERGLGVILASAHLGSVSVCGQVVVSRGFEVSLPVERETSALARLVNRARSSHGLTFVFTDSPLGIHRVLKRGGTLGILVDRAVTGVGERVPFFGREALLPSAHVALALRTGAALLPAFAERDRHGLVARFEPEITLVRTGDHAADVREGMRRFLVFLEDEIRRRPAEWSVFERLWER